MRASTPLGIDAFPPNIPLHPILFSSRIQLALPSLDPCPVPAAKIIWFTADPNHRPIAVVSSHSKGRIAIVTNAGRDAVDASGAADESIDLADGEVVWS
jgi:hypothetical protein